MVIAQAYACYNHETIRDRIFAILKRLCKAKCDESIVTPHNYVDVIDKRPILRKGSINASEGLKVGIPLNMRDGTAICIGKGNEQWLNTAPHGAGRALSRTQAKKQIDIDEFKRSMDGIFSTSVCAGTLDESPQAYKPADEILSLISPTVSVLTIVRPKLNIKRPRKMKKYIQITAGRGPVECARAVALVAKELMKEYPLLHLVDAEEHDNEPGCFTPITFSCNAEKPQLEAMARNWEGSILYRATANSYRPTHKRRNWFVGVNFIDEIELPDVSETDIRYESCRSGGKGGQNVNKVETAVRAIHISSGISVRCSDERSQSQNKALARERLLLKLKEKSQELLATATKDAWSNHSDLQRGNPVKTFSGKL